MKAIIFTLTFCGIYSVLLGQPSQDIIIREKSDNGLVDVDTLIGIKNKTLRFEYDTLYIINKTGLIEFVRCANDLNKVKNLSGSLNGLSFDLSVIQSNVDSMYTNMKSVTTFIKGYERDTKVKLDVLSNDNDKLLKNMESMKKDLNEARQTIKAEKWKSIGSKILWGAGGFVIGGLLFTSLIVIR
ncbi:hypothetical protein [Sporocytophaga myxococcoides]|uniref:hypothetical protein n=1 Tax=Sporocytophaga myxococcoides TaxID=153721 RepID=UPI00041FD19F|nr:hypothetical protein [Sporocytophaga myxococcoides]